MTPRRRTRIRTNDRLCSNVDCTWNLPRVSQSEHIRLGVLKPSSEQFFFSSFSAWTAYPDNWLNWIQNISLYYNFSTIHINFVKDCPQTLCPQDWISSRNYFTYESQKGYDEHGWWGPLVGLCNLAPLVLLELLEFLDLEEVKDDLADVNKNGSNRKSEPNLE